MFELGWKASSAVEWVSFISFPFPHSPSHSVTVPCMNKIYIIHRHWDFFVSNQKCEEENLTKPTITQQLQDCI